MVLTNFATTAYDERMKITTLDLGEYKPVLISPEVGAWRYEKKLPLKTETGKLRVIALGVGGAFSNQMFQSNFIVVKGNNALFIDLGSKATLKLSEMHLSAHDVKNLLVTHSHADHIGSLEELALKRRYEAPFIELSKGNDESMGDYFGRVMKARSDGMFRPTVYIPEHFEKILLDWSLKGGLAFSEKTESGEMNMDHYFKVVHLEQVDSPDDVRDSWDFTVRGDNPEDDIHIHSFLTNHVPDTAATIEEAFYTTGITIDNRVMVSGDTKFDREMVEHFGKDVEIIFHDCQHFPGGVHANYNQLKELPDEYKEKMYLYHLSDGMLEIDVIQDGFLGMMKPAPVVYDF